MIRFIIVLVTCSWGMCVWLAGTKDVEYDSNVDSQKLPRLLQDIRETTITASISLTSHHISCCAYQAYLVVFSKCKYMHACMEWSALSVNRCAKMSVYFYSCTNVYCASCNNVSVENIRFWNAVIDCRHDLRLPSPMNEAAWQDVDHAQLQCLRLKSVMERVIRWCDVSSFYVQIVHE